MIQLNGDPPWWFWLCLLVILAIGVYWRTRSRKKPDATISIDTTGIANEIKTAIKGSFENNARSPAPTTEKSRQKLSGEQLHIKETLTGAILFSLMGVVFALIIHAMGSTALAICVLIACAVITLICLAIASS